MLGSEPMSRTVDETSMSSLDSFMDPALKLMMAKGEEEPEPVQARPF